MDQQVVAAAVGVTQPTWSRIETGGTPLSIDQLKRACERLDLLPGNVLREADLASARLARQGVSIMTTTGEPSENTLAFLGGAALTALLLSALAKK
jgi:transcriptional regulator with XRE-family HTH domain